VSFRVTKTYGHELGLSACFRQPQATSHCRFIHGYALGFKVVFEAPQLDGNGWVKDFGGLKPLKAKLVDTFDHKMLLAQDDPHLERLQALQPHSTGTVDGQPCRVSMPEDRALWLADIVVVPKVGCESFARMVWDWAEATITPEERARGVHLVEVECREHAGNAASYMGTN